MFVAVRVYNRLLENWCERYVFLNSLFICLFTVASICVFSRQCGLNFRRWRPQKLIVSLNTSYSKIWKEPTVWGKCKERLLLAERLKIDFRELLFAINVLQKEFCSWDASIDAPALYIASVYTCTCTVQRFKVGYLQ